MASEILNLAAQIVIFHASMTELTPKELVEEIKGVYKLLVSLESKVVIPEPKVPVTRHRKTRSAKMVVSPEAKVVQDEEGPAVGDPDYMEFMSSREG